MKIIIAGGTGFIGRILTSSLLERNDYVTVISRDKNKIFKLFSNKVHALEWNELSSVKASDYNAIINLTGANIAEKRWTNRAKAEILSSRINSVTTLIDWCKKSSGTLPHLYNASAIGYYGLQSDIPEKNLFFTEDYKNPDRLSNGYSARLVNQWESAARAAEREAIPVTIMRFGVVLHRHEGMLRQLELPTKLGLSAVLGNGMQPISWVSANDLVRAILFLLEHPDITGIVNIVAPEVVTQRDFTTHLANTLNRPSLLRLPAWLVKIIFGEMGEELLLSGQAVSPQRLLNQQFSFKYPTLLDALKCEYTKN